MKLNNIPNKARGTTASWVQSRTVLPQQTGCILNNFVFFSPRCWVEIISTHTVGLHLEPSFCFLDVRTQPHVVLIHILILWLHSFGTNTDKIIPLFLNTQTKAKILFKFLKTYLRCISLMQYILYILYEAKSLNTPKVKIFNISFSQLNIFYVTIHFWNPRQQQR